MTKPVFIIGAGGHAKVLIDALKLGNIPIMGISEREPASTHKVILGIPIICTDEELLQYSPEGLHLVNGLGSIRDCSPRRELYERFKARGFAFLQVIHPFASIASEVELSEGVQVMAGAVIQTGTRIAENTVVNTKASVDHDCQIGPHVHLAPGVTVCGGVKIEGSVHVGSGAIIVQGVTVGTGSLIAAGALVLQDVPARSTVMGVPGRIES